MTNFKSALMLENDVIVLLEEEKERESRGHVNEFFFLEGWASGMEVAREMKRTEKKIRMIKYLSTQAKIIYFSSVSD